jgi:hypothetical protein
MSDQEIDDLVIRGSGVLLRPGRASRVSLRCPLS